MPPAFEPKGPPILTRNQARRRVGWESGLVKRGEAGKKGGMLERWFHLREQKTTVRREVLGGLTTFAAMSYILVVNPGILETAGMPFGAVVTATALAAAASTLLMALLTNYPIALAPGMGINAFFAFTVCVGLGVPWQAALGLVFYNGVLFFILSVSGLRKRIVQAIPYSLKMAVTCGIGIFIAFIGLDKGGVIVADKATLVALGDLSSPGPLLVLAGIALTGILMCRKVPGAMILGVLVLTAAGWLVTGADGQPLASVPERVVSMPASLAPTFLQMDLLYLWTHFHKAFVLVLAFLFVDLFDTMGTLIGVCQRVGLLDKNGELPKIDRALAADASASMIGAALGTSTTTSYIESAAGTEAGGRTGLTGVVVALCFVVALFFLPVIEAVPGFAVAPALVVVGVLMMQCVLEIKLKDLAVALPAVVTILGIPLTYSISDGIALGFIMYVAMMSGTGRWREISGLSYGLAAIFLLHFTAAYWERLLGW